MVIANEQHIVRRLSELLGWADYITESLTMDQRYETGKREMLERLVGEKELKELCRSAWSLRERLHVIATQIELSGVELPVAEAAPR